MLTTMTPDDATHLLFEAHLLVRHGPERSERAMADLAPAINRLDEVESFYPDLQVEIDPIRAAFGLPNA